MLILREPVSGFAKRTEPAQAEAYWGGWNAYIGAMATARIVVNGDGLHPPHTATTVRVRDGKRIFEDGPLADTKAQPGGYFVRHSGRARGGAAQFRGPCRHVAAAR